MYGCTNCLFLLIHWPCPPISSTNYRKRFCPKLVKLWYLLSISTDLLNRSLHNYFIYTFQDINAHFHYDDEMPSVFFSSKNSENLLTKAADDVIGDQLFGLKAWLGNNWCLSGFCNFFASPDFNHSSLRRRSYLTLLLLKYFLNITFWKSSSFVEACYLFVFFSKIASKGLIII